MKQSLECLREGAYVEKSQQFLFCDLQSLEWLLFIGALLHDLFQSLEIVARNLSTKTDNRP